MTRCRVRRFEGDDIPGLVHLCREHAAFERAQWTERCDRAAQLGKLLQAADTRCWVVDGDRELAGYTTAMLERSTWDAAPYLHLDCLFLRPRYRGLGLGQQLMAAVRAAARDLGAAQIQWQTPAWNHEAVRFYRRLGATSTAKIRFAISAD